MSDLNQLRDEVHALAVSKGWHENRDITDPNVLGAMLALIHSEVSEALEAIRRIKSPSRFLYEDQVSGQTLSEREREDGQPDSRYKPHGVPSEMADVIIRVLDMCGAMGIDIDRAVTEKHAFNKTRSHRHGGKSL